MTYQEIVNYLNENKDANFAIFSKRLLNSTLNVIGVKTPILRKLIKEHYSDDDLKLEDFEHGQYVEIENIYFEGNEKEISYSYSNRYCVFD